MSFVDIRLDYTNHANYIRIYLVTVLYSLITIIFAHIYKKKIKILWKIY